MTGTLRVRLLDYRRDGPPHHLVTQLIDGVDPCRWCQETGADLAAIVGVSTRSAEVVDHAHTEGVCHRDPKPANFLIDASGTPHVLDFGLAHVLPPEQSPGPMLTEASCILGSLAYVAPEEAADASHQADARSDVYSRSGILYELMTGQVPVQGPLHSLLARAGGRSHRLRCWRSSAVWASCRWERPSGAGSTSGAQGFSHWWW